MNIQPPVIAHRGANDYAPENTLAAFRKAKELGAQWVEFDVMLSADNELVVIHDDTLERTTNGKGLVCEHTYQQLNILDAGTWFKPSFAAEKIPTLRAVIDLLIELQLSANIEIKAQPGKEAFTAQAVLALLKQHWPAAMSAPLISSFSLTILEKVRQYSPESMIGFLMDEWQPDWENKCDSLQAAAVNVNHEILTPHRAAAIKKTQRLLLAYTVNDVQRAGDLFAWGVDAVFTDRLEVMLRMGDMR